MKELCIALCVLLVMSLTGLAQAEVRCVAVGIDCAGEEDAYYGVFETDAGDSVKLMLTEEEYMDAIRSVIDRKEAERKAENPTWFESAIDWITFWD